MTPDASTCTGCPQPGMRHSRGDSGAWGTALALGAAAPEDAGAAVFRNGLLRGCFGCGLAGAGMGVLTGGAAGATGGAGAGTTAGATAGTTAARKLCTWGMCCATWGMCCATSSVANELMRSDIRDRRTGQMNGVKERIRGCLWGSYVPACSPRGFSRRLGRGGILCGTISRRGRCCSQSRAVLAAEVKVLVLWLVLTILRE